MKKIALVAEPSRKTNGYMMADIMFAKSPLYRYIVNYCRKNFDEIYILSAKYYLIKPTDVIHSYDEDINQFNEDSLTAWQTYTAQLVWDNLPRRSQLYFFAGKQYRTLIRDIEMDYECFEPTQHMRIGQQLKYFSQFEEKFL